MLDLPLLVLMHFDLLQGERFVDLCVVNAAKTERTERLEVLARKLRKQLGAQRLLC